MDIAYTIVRSQRKTISLQITPQGQVVVRCPRRMARKDIDAFVRSKESWLRRHLETGKNVLPPLTQAELAFLTEAAREDLSRRLQRLAPLVGVPFGRVTVRHQKTRWGSCSAQGNLNFNCLLMLCPEDVRDYVVIHELCHRKEMNHSPRFWAEVERVMPDFSTPRAWLKEQGGALIRRLP